MVVNIRRRRDRLANGQFWWADYTEGGIVAVAATSIVKLRLVRHHVTIVAHVADNECKSDSRVRGDGAVPGKIVIDDAGSNRLPTRDPTRKIHL